MKFKTIHIALFFTISSIVLSIGLPAIAQKTGVTVTDTVTADIDTVVTDTMAYEPHRRFDYFFLDAVREQNAGNYDKAYQLLRYCLKLNPDAAEVHYMLSKHYLMQKNDSLALASIEKAAQLRPENPTYIERVAQHYISGGRYDDAIRAYEKLYAYNKENEEALNILMQLYQQKKDYSSVLNTINRLEDLNGNDEKITLAKVRVYEMMDDKKAALQTLRNLADEHPHDLNYKLMIGNWLMQNERQKEAYKIFAKAMDEEPDNTYAQASMYDYYVAEQQEAKAKELMDKMLISNKTESSTKLGLLRQVIQENETQKKDSTEILQLFDRIMQANPKDGSVAELKAAYMSLKKMPDSLVEKAMEDVLAINPDNAPMRIQLIQSKWNDKNWDEIIALSKAAQAYNPEEMAFYYFMGLAYFQKDDKDKALDAFQRGVDEINENSNKDFVSDFYAIMGDILHQKGKLKEAFASYDNCLQWKPDNLGCLNNYAYFLCLEGYQLEKAEEMSHKTIKAVPTNATYLDTYAWILFRQKRYSEAQIYIDQALANDTDSIQSAEVLEHAGDIYAMNGNMTKALLFWQKALNAGSDSVTLPKKLKQKKYIRKQKHKARI